MDILDIVMNIYEDKKEKKVYENKFQKLDEIYFRGEELFRIGEYRAAREQFMAAELEGRKVYDALLDKPPFLKRCSKRQDECLDQILKVDSLQNRIKTQREM